MSEILNDYIRDGYILCQNIISKEENLSLRQELKKEYENIVEKKSIQLLLDDLKNPILIKKIINLLNSEQIKRSKMEFEKFSENKVSILPLFEIHKNNHVNLKKNHGWHRDCGVEMDNNYCRNILYKKNYIFSKIGIYLQENGDYGGCIDVVKKSHKNFTKNQSLIRKIKNIPLKIINFINQSFNKIYFQIPETFLMKFLNAKKLMPKEGSAIIFDSRITHRSSTILKEKFEKLKFEGSFKAVVPEIYDKYVIYCHFGTSEAVDSYFFKRLVKTENPNLLQLWIRQINFISQYNKNLAEQMNEVISPIKEKYKKYI